MTLFDFVKERYDMAYSELIKNFNRIRTYLRSFYVYGFRHRDEFTQKSARSYDNERRRLESWLGEYMSFGQDEEGRLFLKILCTGLSGPSPLRTGISLCIFISWIF